MGDRLPINLTILILVTASSRSKQVQPAQIVLLELLFHLGFMVIARLACFLLHKTLPPPSTSLALQHFLANVIPLHSLPPNTDFRDGCF